jgi:hypothetical protein
MTASERFGLTLERTTSGAVDPRLQVQPKFCLRKSRNPFRPGGGKPSGVTISAMTTYGVSPIKVRKVPQDSCQLPGRKGFSAIPELPRRDLV